MIPTKNVHDNTYTILIVDDTRLNIRILERALSREGYRILTAANGMDGRALALAEQPDLVLLDIVMPGENGFETLQRLKSDHRTAHIPVVFISGEDHVETKVSGLDAGAVDYITKPFHLEEVKARVRLHIRLSIATRALLTVQAEKLKEIQKAQSELLTLPEDLPHARFGVVYRSLQEAGGDFYDVFSIGDRIFGYFLSDVSGHDLATSFLTSALKALLKQNCSAIYKPTESMGMVNHVLLEILPSGKYLTASYLVVNRASQQVSVVGMGHPPVVYQPVAGAPRLIELDGDILGAFQEVNFGAASLDVQSGDRFILYSDGLMERTESGTVWSELGEPLLAMVEQVPRFHNAQEAADLLTELANLQYGNPDDDVVVLVVEV
ncbi:SpoIIE family protein phosphatase [Acanthopleuribacter pedis]|uniref:Response regulator n=1 Tax=Acanthopleuribacter pedis TaxID=442870 RepID=A0A8J7QB85_9BACT|nr:SpoIIE family protein phosphatase [Acanthopleuribacter pedis]MBO1317696.1 response regulator [Acanthopleuribacter pedis]